DTLTINLGLKQAASTAQSNPQDAIKLYERLLTESRQISYSYGIAKASIEVANLWAVQGQNERALFYYKNAGAAIEQQNGLQHLLPVILSNMGISYDALGRFEQAAVCFIQALEKLDQYPTRQIS